MKISKNIYFGLDQNLRLSVIKPEKNPASKRFQENLDLLIKNGFEIRYPDHINLTCDVKINENWERWYLGWIVPYGIKNNYNSRVQIRKQINPNLIDRIFAIKRFKRKNLFFLTEKKSRIINETESLSSFVISLKHQIFWRDRGDCLYEHKTRGRQTTIILFSKLTMLKKLDLSHFQNNSNFQVVSEEKLNYIQKRIKSEITKLNNKVFNSKKTFVDKIVYLNSEENSPIRPLNDINEEVNDYIYVGKKRKSKLQKKWAYQITRIYRKTCFLTGLKGLVLHASHIKPYSKCSQMEKFDFKNGILLSPTFHYLFDQGFFTFQPNGQILFSKTIPPKMLSLIKKWLLWDPHRSPTITELIDKKYLDYHRNKIFKKI